MPRRLPFSHRLLLVAAKVPEAGRVKTRLANGETGNGGNGLGEAGAARLAQAFLADTLQKAADCPVPADIWLALDGEMEKLPEALRPSGVRLVKQEGPDLGEKMARLFDLGFAEGYPQIVIIGSDTPHLPPAFLVDAWGRLEAGADVVLGPTDDGGYYLMGLKQARPDLLQDIAWSTSTVLGQTREKARDAGLSVGQTPPWYDIDTPDDLRRLRTDLERGSVSAPYTRAALGDE